MRVVFQIGGFWVFRLYALGPNIDSANVALYWPFRHRGIKGPECLPTIRNSFRKQSALINYE